jgi:hypothetical protein
LAAGDRRLSTANVGIACASYHWSSVNWRLRDHSIHNWGAINIGDSTFDGVSKKVETDRPNPTSSFPSLIGTETDDLSVILHTYDQ